MNAIDSAGGHHAIATQTEEARAHWCFEHWVIVTGSARDSSGQASRAFAHAVLELGLEKMNSGEPAAWFLLRSAQERECPSDDGLVKAFEEDMLVLGLAEMERRLRLAWAAMEGSGCLSADAPMGFWVAGQGEA